MLYLLSDEDDMPKAPAKKNKKRWCGGHEGREHVPIITRVRYSGAWQCGYRDYRWRKNHYTDKVTYACWHEVTCDKCHKVLQFKVDSCPDKQEALVRYMKEKENT